MENIIYTTKPEIDKIPGGWESSFFPFLREVHKGEIGVESGPKNYGRAHIFKNLFTERECDEMVRMFMQSPNFEDVSIQGRKDVPDDRVGSIRTTVWNTGLAEEMWYKKFSNILFNRSVFSSTTPTDWWQGDKSRRIWYTHGISPMMRFMKYEKSGQHYAHYDAGYIYPDDNFRTLYSFVLYLTTSKNGGATRFIQDNQSHLNVWERNHEDWIREAREDEVVFKSEAVKGNVLIFPHRYCHDVEQYLGDEPRIIIRGDIIFKANNENY